MGGSEREPIKAQRDKELDTFAMTNSRSISSNVRLRLFSDAAGFCQNPGCLQPLFVEQDTHVAEMIHIIAHSDRGPRANTNMDAEYRESYDNLLILCPTCHETVDKRPDLHPRHQLIQWKKNHIAKITAAFGLDYYDSRQDTRSAIEPLMDENYSIFQRYGPDNEYHLDPESEEARVWQRKVLSRILPNNRKVLLVIDKNKAMLSTYEKSVLEDFRQHVEEMEARHLGGMSTVARRFPSGMQNILTGRK